MRFTVSVNVLSQIARDFFCDSTYFIFNHTMRLYLAAVLKLTSYNNPEPQKFSCRRGE